MDGTTAFNDIVTGVSAAVVAILAAVGLNTWKTQLRGTAEYELARRLLRCIYKIRNELEYVRAPLMSAGEMSAAAEAAGETLDGFSSEKHNRAFELAMHRRWRRLGDARAEMEAELLEAEVLWGPIFKSAEAELNKLLFELSWAIDEMLQAKRSSSQLSVEERRANHDIVWSSGRIDAKSAFTMRIDASVRQFEDLLKPKLDRLR